MIPALRITTLRDAPPRPNGHYVLYWMIASRRTRSNFALQRAIEWAKQLNKPLVVLEALRCGYQWASDRFHRFVIEGMRDNQRAFSHSPVCYIPFIESNPTQGKGLLAALAEQSCVVITDDFPCFMLPNMVAAAAKQVSVRFESIDSNGLLPLRAASTTFPTAYAFRRFLQKNLAPFLTKFPEADPLHELTIPRLSTPLSGIAARWPSADLGAQSYPLSALPIDHSVSPAPLRGGSEAAQARLSYFCDTLLPRYGEDRNQPDSDGSSGLSPYLHFGHISTFEIAHKVFAHHQWTPERLSKSVAGKREGWWGLPAHVEGFLDELVTWRELGYNMSSLRPDYAAYESLPEWAQQTLEKHSGDPRPVRYELEELRGSKTHDPIWNAAQRQLLSEGRMHNYLRMLWGKKILEWSRTPRDALAAMIELNNRYALDGRNPNSYSGIFWVLGRYDRPWGPERPIFGTIRYMSSDNTARKLELKKYLKRYAETGHEEH